MWEENCHSQKGLHDEHPRSVYSYLLSQCGHRGGNLLFDVSTLSRAILTMFRRLLNLQTKGTWIEQEKLETLPSSGRRQIGGGKDQNQGEG